MNDQHSSEDFQKIPTMAAWIDLLGYGDMLRKAAPDYAPQELRKALSRLRLFHQTILEHTDTSAPALVVNDGAVSVRDIPPTAQPNDMIDFIRAVGLLHYATNAEDQRAGGVGVRTVMCIGFRTPLGTDYAVRFSALRQAMREQRPDLLEASKDDQLGFMEDNHGKFGIGHYLAVEQLQFNFAFSKAWCADKAGSQSGLCGPTLFLEQDVLLQAFENDQSELSRDHGYHLPVPWPPIATISPEYTQGHIRWKRDTTIKPIHLDQLGIEIKFIPVEVHYLRELGFSREELREIEKIGKEPERRWKDGTDPPWY